MRVQTPTRKAANSMCCRSEDTFHGVVFLRSSSDTTSLVSVLLPPRPCGQLAGTLMKWESCRSSSAAGHHSSHHAKGQLSVLLALLRIVTIVISEYTLRCVCACVCLCVCIFDFFFSLSHSAISVKYANLTADLCQNPLLLLIF